MLVYVEYKVNKAVHHPDVTWINPGVLTFICLTHVKRDIVNVYVDAPVKQTTVYPPGVDEAITR